MSAQQDYNAISSLLEDQHLHTTPMYHERTLEYIQPTSLGPYTSFIEFNLSSLASRFTDFSKAFLQIPFTILPGAGTFKTVPFPALAFKSSFASFIAGIYLKDGRNTPLVDDRTSGAFANHIRMCIENDASFTITRGPQIGFAMDKSAKQVRSLTTVAQIQYPNVSQYSDVPKVGVADSAILNGDSLAYNAGFAERVSYLQDTTVSAGGVIFTQPSGATTYVNGINGVFNMPLSYLHSFFKQLDFPITGLSLTLQIMLNTTVNSGGFCPVSLGSTSINAGVNVPDSGDVGLSGAGVVQPSNISVIVTKGDVAPRLYYHAVEFSAVDGRRALEQLSKGYVKTIRYQQYDVINSSQQLNQVAGKSLTHTITPSVLAPRRVFILCHPAGVVNTSSWPSVLCTGPFGLSQMQLLVNNKPLFRAPLDTLGEQYAMLQSAMGVSSDDGDESRSLISFSDFQRNTRLICLDMSRLTSIIPDPNVPLSLILTATPVAPGPMDIVYIVQRDVEVKMSFGAGRDTAVSVSPATLV